jgi:hypothetical protein
MTHAPEAPEQVLKLVQAHLAGAALLALLAVGCARPAPRAPDARSDCADVTLVGAITSGTAALAGGGFADRAITHAADRRTWTVLAAGAFVIATNAAWGTLLYRARRSC